MNAKWKKYYRWGYGKGKNEDCFHCGHADVDLATNPNYGEHQVQTWSKIWCRLFGFYPSKLSCGSRKKCDQFKVRENENS